MAARALREGVDRIHSVARFHVSESLRGSLLRHNRVNRELLELATNAGNG